MYSSKLPNSPNYPTPILLHPQTNTQLIFSSKNNVQLSTTLTLISQEHHDQACYRHEPDPFVNCINFADKTIKKLDIPLLVKTSFYKKNQITHFLLLLYIFILHVNKEESFAMQQCRFSFVP